MATACEDDDGVPPLEDLSELISQMKTLQSATENDEKFSNANDKATTVTIENDESNVSQKQTKMSETINSTHTFGGFQKGFLNKKIKDSCARPKQTKPPKDESIPTIHPKQEDSNSLRFPEVQEAVEMPSILQNKDWITDNLLKKLEGRPDLLQKLADPRYSQALNLLRINPEEGLKLIQGNKELQSFIKDFCGILGEHFTTMAEQTKSSEVDGKSVSPPTTASNADEEKMSQILSNPETMEVLKDPWISKLIKNLKDNPPEARRMLATSRPEVLPKIKKLIDAGILSYG